MPSIIKLDMIAWIRDITQVYVQSETGLNCKILAYLPIQIYYKYPERMVMQVIKSLYRIVEVGTH
jgi:hypothetical protein